MSILERGDSPFQPGQPVSPNKFQGREDIINEIVRYFPAALHGKPQHFFITGKRGMGKTSLAHFISNYAENNFSMITAHIMNDGVNSIDELIIQIIERILNSIRPEKWSDKIFDFFDEHIEKIGIGGINIKFKPSKDELDNIKDNFAFYLTDLVNNFEDKDGIFIVIDDINGLSETPEFANWYKSFTDTLATSFYEKAPIAIMLTGYPEKFNKLYDHNPSFSRIFHLHKVSTLNNDEIINFYKEIFESNNFKWEEESLKFMAKYSSGMPTMMQEIGEATFLVDNDYIISKKDGIQGIINAGKIIGLKYLQPLLDEKIRSEKYISILDKSSEKLATSPDDTFTKKEFMDILSESEIKVFKDFISRARKLGIIELASSKKQGVYQFTNNLYPIYFYIQTINKDKSKIR